MEIKQLSSRETKSQQSDERNEWTGTKIEQIHNLQLDQSEPNLIQNGFVQISTGTNIETNAFQEKVREEKGGQEDEEEEKEKKGSGTRSRRWRIFHIFHLIYILMSPYFFQHKIDPHSKLQKLI